MRTNYLDIKKKRFAGFIERTNKHRKKFIRYGLYIIIENKRMYGRNVTIQIFVDLISNRVYFVWSSCM